MVQHHHQIHVVVENIPWQAGIFIFRYLAFSFTYFASKQIILKICQLFIFYISFLFFSLIYPTSEQQFSVQPPCQLCEMEHSGISNWQDREVIRQRGYHRSTQPAVHSEWAHIHAHQQAFCNDIQVCFSFRLLKFSLLQEGNLVYCESSKRLHRLRYSSHSLTKLIELTLRQDSKVLPASRKSAENYLWTRNPIFRKIDKIRTILIKPTRTSSIDQIHCVFGNSRRWTYWISVMVCW